MLSYNYTFTHEYIHTDVKTCIKQISFSFSVVKRGNVMKREKILNYQSQQLYCNINLTNCL